MKKVIILLFAFFLSPNIFGETMIIKYYGKYYFKEEELNIAHKIQVTEKSIPYLKSFWRVYYKKNGDVLGEEFYRNWRLQYYFLYQYANNRTDKKGFYWFGITDKAFFSIKKRTIWQGYYFKRNPDVWWIYDAQGRLISKSYYQQYQVERIKTTDRYFYNNNRVERIERYRRGELTKMYRKK